MVSRGLAEEVAGRQWYHTIELGDGLVTPGWFDLRGLVDELPFPARLDGQRCLDVGTFDGFWAFEMERRGAAEVVAVDIPDPDAWDWPAHATLDVRRRIAQRHESGAGFEIAHRCLGSEVRRQMVSVYDLEPERLGTFDLVYVGSLLLHLRDPVRALEAVRSVCRGRMLLVDAIDWWTSICHPRRPVATLEGLGRPWWWKPNAAALTRMAVSAGFELVEHPRRVKMPPGPGQPRRQRPVRALRSRVGREALISSIIGDPHLALLARPQTPGFERVRSGAPTRCPGA